MSCRVARRTTGGSALVQRCIDRFREPLFLELIDIDFARPLARSHVRAQLFCAVPCRGLPAASRLHRRMGDATESIAPTERSKINPFSGVLAAKLSHRQRRNVKRVAQREATGEPKRVKKKTASTAASATKPKGPIQVATVALTGNRFELLGQAMDASDGSPDDAAQKGKSPKIAPITVTAVGSDIAKLFSSLPQTGATYTTKMITLGIRIHPLDMRSKTAIIAFLIANKHTYFTHPEKSTDVFRHILTGLPTLPTDEIKALLKTESGAAPKSVSMIPSSSKYNERRLYVVEWNAGEMNKAKVMEIKTLGHHRIGWEKPRKRANGPTLCRQCQMYGHGKSHCFRSTICGLCALAHDSATCPLIHDKNAAIKYVCVNCINTQKKDTNHRADWDQCPSRLMYMQARAPKSTQRNNKSSHQQPSKSARASAPLNQSTAEFPPLNRASVAPPASRPVYTERSYANAARTPTPPPHARFTSDAPNLFSMDQIAAIMTNTMGELLKCTTKLEQLQVVAKMIALAYD